MNYVHPSISSSVIDNSVTYVTAQGTTKLYAVVLSDIGEDNVIKLITTPSEYEFYYGKPDIKKHGQAPYNVMNWLKSGGGAFILRVLPENAGYSNAIVNIQTKESVKRVLDYTGKEVELSDVTIRPTVTYTGVNNTSMSAIEFDELRKPQTQTIDGFRNNMIFAVIPRGRGKAYDDLGFRLTLTEEYDSTYDFRVYNFEACKVLSNGGVDTIEGPFKVSLDPDAKSLSGESMFIKYVVEKYSEYFNIIFNEDNYDDLAAIINPHVNPNKIDFFNAQTRVIDGKTETYLDPITQKEEDIHISVHRYINGLPTGELNIVDTSDNIESTIVNIDNTHRSEKYQITLKTIDRMKEALSAIKKISGPSNPYKSLIEPLILDGNGTLHKKLEDVKTVYDEIIRLETEIAKPDAPANTLELLQRASSNFITYTKILISEILKGLDYVRVCGESEQTIKVTTEIDKIKSKLSILENYGIKFSSLIKDLSNFDVSFNNILIENVDSAKEKVINDAIILFEDLVNKIISIQIEGQTEADKAIERISAKIATLVAYNKEITGEYTSEEDYKVAMLGAINEIKSAVDDLYECIDLTLIEIQLNEIKEIQTINTSQTGIMVSLVEQAITVSTDLNTDDVIATIKLYETQVVSMKQITYKTSLQNYDSSVILAFGSDGDLDEENPDRDTVIDSLLIKGYTGLIDDRLLDKKMFPIDIVLDANYNVGVKNAIVQLVTQIRKDFMALLDTNYQSTPAQAIEFRRSKLTVSNYAVAIYAQDFIVNDAEYSGQNIKVTTPYFLASKIPSNDNTHGIHWNFAGPRRGTISGFETLSYNPNPEWKERLYKAQVNYVEQDPSRTKFGTQLTSQTTVSALSNISNVRTLLRIQRDVEALMEDYQFEFNDSITTSTAQLNLNGYLNQWVTNRACDSISGSVYASEYDRKEKLLRVRVDLIFNSIIERIAIDLVVNR